MPKHTLDQQRQADVQLVRILAALERNGEAVAETKTRVQRLAVYHVTHKHPVIITGFYPEYVCLAKATPEGTA